MDYTIPSAANRIVLQHGDDAEPGKQNELIVAYAQGLDLEERYVGVEVFYARTQPYRESSTEEDFDAVLVDTEEGKIVETLPPYDEIDPDWKSKREEASDE